MGTTSGLIRDQVEKIGMLSGSKHFVGNSDLLVENTF